MAIRPESLLPLAAVEIIEMPIQISRDHLVELSVTIQIHPGSRSGPCPPSDARLVRDVREGAVAIVVIQGVTPVTGDEEIFQPIIVEISNSDSGRIPDALQARLLRHIFKTSIRLLVIEPIPVLRSRLLRESIFRHVLVEWRAIRKEQIEPAVVVIIERRHPRTHRFQ